MDLKIDTQSDGKTVLEILKRDLGISRATIKHLKFKNNGITVDGEHVTVRRILHDGEILSLAVEDDFTPQKLTPSDLGLRIVYEDDDVIVPDKPSDMPTHQSFGHYSDTVANALAYRYTSQGTPYVFRPVNRLDRNTSGLLLIARNRLSAAFLSDQMKKGNVKKQYVAILHGLLTDDHGVIDTYMRRTAQSVIVREVCDENGGGDRAITKYQVICRSDTHTMVIATPVTGRTHQLRVHFAHVGCPIVGDDLYGSESDLIGRHALHSFFLSFPSKNGDSVTVTAPLQEDMMRLASNVFEDRLSEIPADIAEYILPKSEEKSNEI